MFARQRRSFRTAAGLMTIGMLALSGCSSSSNSDSSSGSPSGSQTASLRAMKTDLATFSGQVTDLPRVTPVPKASSLHGKTVWWVPLGSAVDAGIGPTLKTALDKLGVRLHTCNGNFLPTTVAGCLQQASSQGADAVMTGYVDYKSIPTAFDSLAARGIPVLLAGAVNNSGRKQTAAFAFADTTSILKRAARTQLEAAIVGSGGKGRLLWVGSSDSAQLASITTYARSFVHDHCSGCSFDQFSINSASLPKLTSQASAELTSHAGTNYVLTEIDPFTPLVVQAIKTAGLQDKVKVIGTGPLPDTLLDLQKGDSPLVADTGISNSYETWAFTESLVQMMTGVVPPAQVQTIYRLFDSSNAKGLPATAKAYTTVEWFASKSAVASSYATAWGVS